jgi:hypothetical protein
MIYRKYNAYFIKNDCFGAKSREIAHTKTALAAKVADIFEMEFCFASSKDQIKMCKMAILSSHALPENSHSYTDFYFV